MTRMNPVLAYNEEEEGTVGVHATVFGCYNASKWRAIVNTSLAIISHLDNGYRRRNIAISYE